MDHLASILELGSPQSEIVWDDSYDSKFSDLLMVNDRLFGALSDINYKAAFALSRRAYGNGSRTALPGVGSI